MHNEKLLDTINSMGIKLENKIIQIEHQQTITNNPQSLWKQFKDNITKITRKTTQTNAAKLDNKIKALKKDIRDLANDSAIDNDKGMRQNENPLCSKLNHLEKKGHTNVKSRAIA